MKIETKRTYEVTFDDPKRNATWTFERHESEAFNYGNGTAVSISKNGEFVTVVDTRYDHTVIRDFSKWCEEFMQGYFRKELNPTWREKPKGSNSRRYVCPCCKAIVRSTKDLHMICGTCKVDFELT